MKDSGAGETGQLMSGSVESQVDDIYVKAEEKDCSDKFVQLDSHEDEYDDMDDFRLIFTVVLTNHH